MTFAVPEPQKHTMFFQWVSCLCTSVMSHYPVKLHGHRCEDHTFKRHDPREDANRCWQNNRVALLEEEEEALPAMGNSWERKEYAKVSGREKKPTPTTSSLLLLNKDQFVPSTKLIYKSKNNNYLEVFGLFVFQQYIKMSFVKEILWLL